MSPKTSRTALQGAPGFKDLLADAASDTSSTIDAQNQPGVAFRALYDGWVRQGGYLRGKPRRSVRQIKTWLGSNREVRSLETKLSGKTLLQLDDLRNLISLFLERWRYDAGKGEDQAYPHSKLDQLAEDLVTEIYVDNGNGRGSGLQLPRRGRQAALETVPLSTQTTRQDEKSADVPDDTLESGDAITALYKQSDALITVSRERTFIGADPGSIMSGFHTLMDELRAIDDSDDRFRALIWIVDSGRREGDPGSQTILHNLDFLATQFRSLLLTDHPRRTDRARWFMQRAVVLVGTLRFEEIDACYTQAGLELMEPKRGWDWITADRLFIEGVPDRWFERVSKEGAEAIRQRTITVHRDLQQPKQERPGDASWADIRYLFHAPLRGGDNEIRPRCVELPSPGVRWSDAFRVAHEVALLRLGRPFKPAMRYKPKEELALLRNHRLAALTVVEFCKLTNHLAFEEFN